ncbi:MAG: hypothetical protein DSY35_01590 [Desulfurobacterium sp.]|nr:MAG: hypothetical protein DSY35_01590 [Desulfurobacterium sp.]
MGVEKVGANLFQNVWESKPESQVKKERKRNVPPFKDDQVVADISASTFLTTINRLERIEKLRLLIEEGLYKLDSKAIAESIVEELLR